MRKHLRNNSEVAHFWANRSQSEGQSKSMFFEGKSIYSYGHHYEAGRFVVDDNGRRVVFLNSHRYSITTAMHMGHVRSAVSHFPSFNILDFDNLAHSLSDLVKIAMTDKEKMFKATKHIKRNHTWYKDSAYEAIKFYQSFRKKIVLQSLPRDQKSFFNHLRKYDYAGEFGSHMNSVTGEPNWALTEKEIIEVKTRVDRAAYMERTREDREPALEKARLKREEAKQRKFLEKRATDIINWRAGKMRYLYQSPMVLLRLNEDRDRVETSGGAEISVRMALKLWDRFKAKADVTDFDLGPYRVDSYQDETLIVGCHRIPLSEIQRIAAALGA